MTTVSVILLAVFVMSALVDWLAVARQNDVLEYISKPTATAALLATAATLDVTRDASWVWLLIALVFCLLGDVFLMLPRDSFIQGLASFAVAQVLFTVSFATRETSANRLIFGLVIIVPVAVWLARRFIAAIRQSGRSELVAPVLVYMVVISAMTTASIAAGNPTAIAGAVMFMVSDSLIAESRFVNEKPWHGVGIMATYHTALAGFVLGLI